MRKIERAVIVQSIHRSDTAKLRSAETKTTFCVSDEFFEDQGRKRILGILAKYIVFKDQDHSYWIDRYWYFDVEKYENDLRSFGVPLAMPVMEPVTKY